MEYGYDLLTALSILIIGKFILTDLQYIIKKGRLERDFYMIGEEDGKSSNGLAKILKDEDKNIKF